MSLFTFLIRFSTGVVTLLWVHVWKWAYPQSAAVVEELARKEIDLVEHGSSVWKLLRLSIDLPGIARSQQTIEVRLLAACHLASFDFAIAVRIEAAKQRVRVDQPPRLCGRCDQSLRANHTQNNR